MNTAPQPTGEGAGYAAPARQDVERCSDCSGSGRYMGDRCDTCQGKGGVNWSTGQSIWAKDVDRIQAEQRGTGNLQGK